MYYSNILSTYLIRVIRVLEQNVLLNWEFLILNKRINNIEYKNWQVLQLKIW